MDSQISHITESGYLKSPIGIEYNPCRHLSESLEEVLEVLEPRDTHTSRKPHTRVLVGEGMVTTRPARPGLDRSAHELIDKSACQFGADLKRLVVEAYERVAVFDRDALLEYDIT